MAEMSYADDIRSVSALDLPWTALGGCNILITGATGLIGSCMVDVLMNNPKRDYCVYAAGRNEVNARERFRDYLGDGRFHFLKYDVREALDSDVDFHYVIHAASNASPNFFSTKPVEVMLSNIEGVKNLLDYGIGHNMRRFMYVSSGEVYGEGDGRDFTEEYSGYVDITKPRSCYPSSKRAAETLCVSYAAEYGADVVIVRPSHTYGPHFMSSDNRVYAQFIRNALKGEDIVMKSSGSQYRSWCYVVDCVSAMFYVLLKGETMQAYNIADHQSNITIMELARMISRISGTKVVCEVPSDGEKAGYNTVTKSVFDTHKTEQLGWSISGTMEEKIQKTICVRQSMP